MVSLENIRHYCSTSSKKISIKTLNFLEDEGYIQKQLIEVDERIITAYSLQQKGKRKAISMGYNIYACNSKDHDIRLSENVFKLVKDRELSVDDYYNEKELKDIEGTSKTDGRFYNAQKNINICVEQTTKNYTNTQKKLKASYASKLDAEYIEF